MSGDGRVSEATQPNSCSGCPLYGKAKGFVLGCGDPTKAKYAIILEAPGRDEISFTLRPNPNRAFLSTQHQFYARSLHSHSSLRISRRSETLPIKDDECLLCWEGKLLTRSYGMRVTSPSGEDIILGLEMDGVMRTSPTSSTPVNVNA